MPAVATADTFLSPRTALVTGSTTGIGLAIPCALGAAGARVAINGLGSPQQIADACRRGSRSAATAGAARA